MNLRDVQKQLAPFEKTLTALDFDDHMVIVHELDEPTHLQFAHAFVRKFHDEPQEETEEKWDGRTSWWYCVYTEHQGTHYFHSSSAHVWELIPTEILEIEVGNL